MIPVTFSSPIHINNYSINIKTDETVIETTENTSEDISTEYEPSTTTQVDGISNTGHAPVEVNNQTPLQSKNVINRINQLLTSNLENIMLATWLCGAVVILLINTYSIYIFNKKLMDCRLICNPQIEKILTTNKAKLKIKQKVKICESDYIDTPMTYGLLIPKILLPTGYMDSVSINKLNLIILHELCHIKRFDLAINYLWLFSKIVYWFNPLIIIAYKAYLEDIELCCDEIVLNNIGSSNRFEYSQTLLDVIKLSKGEMRLPIVMSLCKDKTKIRKRVENMIKPTKKLRTVGCITILVTLVMIFICFTTACLPSTKTVSKLIANQPIKQSIEENREIIFNQIDELDNNFTFDAQGNERVKIIADAEIIIPDLDNVPFIKVVPENISKKQFHKFIDYVIGDRTIYIDGKKVIKDGRITNELEEYDGKLIDSPDDYDYATRTDLITYVHERKPARIGLDQSLDGLESGFNYCRYETSRWKEFNIYTGEDIDGIKKCYEECLQNAIALIEVMDGKDSNLKLNFTLTYENSGIFIGYRFFFERDYSGINVKPMSTLPDNDIFMNYIDPEMLQIFVDDDGIYEVLWSQYKKDYHIIERNLLLADFDTILNTFKDNCNNNFWWIPHDIHVPNDVNAIINVKKIELNYMFVYDDETENYYIVPVWDFIGDMTYDEVVIYEGDPANGGRKDISVLTINAVNGTVINRSLGD